MKRDFLQALGLESGVVDKVMAEYGKNVNAFKDGQTAHDVLKAEHKALQEKYQTDISDFNSKLETAVKSAADYDTLKETLEKVKVENSKLTEDYEQNLVNVRKGSAIDVALLKANVDENYLDMAKSQLNMDQLSFDGDNLIGLTDSITKMQQDFPKLFGEVKKRGTTPPQGVTTPPVDSLKSKYDEALKAGNTREAIKIKQAAFNEGNGF